MSHCVDNVEAKQLLSLGYIFLDVRSEVEFDTGHPPGALNIPLALVRGDQLEENPDFLPVVQALFPTDTRLLLTCHSGARSHRAARILQSHGYASLAELRHGFAGSRDAFGRRLPGWVAEGEVERVVSEPQTYLWLRGEALRRGAALTACDVAE